MKVFLVLIVMVLSAGCASRQEEEPETEMDAAQSFLPGQFGQRSLLGQSPIAKWELYAAQSGGAAYAPWHSNPGRAFAKAKGMGRPLLLLFNAQTWADSSRKLAEEVWVTETFNVFAKEHLVLSYLDYPRNVNEAPESAQAAKEKFGVHGYPTVIVFDPHGNEIFRETGYRPGRARDYFEALKAAVPLESE